MSRPIPLLTVIVTVLILVAVMLPSSSLPDAPGIPGFDKLVHFLMFLTLAVAMHHDFTLEGKRRLITALALGLAFSALTEAVQLFVDGRSSELVDMVADTAGFLTGLAARRRLDLLATKFMAKFSPPR